MPVENFWKKFIKEYGIAGIIFLVILIMLVGGIGGIVTERWILPQLSTIPWLRGISFFQPEAPIIINRREEIRINEGINQTELINSTKDAMVLVYIHEGGFDSGSFRVSGATSGIIISSDGIIAIPNQGVANKNLTAVVSGRDPLPARILEVDEITGLAFLKIEAADLPVVRQGFSTEILAGDRLLVLKAEEAFRGISALPVNALSSGKPVSSLVNVYNLANLNSFLRVDFDFSDFWLGGVVIDRNRQMVGLVSEIEDEIRVLRAEDIKLAVNKLLFEKEINWPAVSVAYQIFGAVQTNLFGISHENGVLIKSGPRPLFPDDFVFEIDGREIAAEQGFQDIIFSKRPGEQVRLRLVRDGEEREVIITL